MAQRRHLHGETELAAERAARRLRRDLGVNVAGIEVVLHLRAQVVSLQARVRALEDELAYSSARRASRIAQLRDAFYEGGWRETDRE
jgi:hypothetical protein